MEVPISLSGFHQLFPHPCLEVSLFCKLAYRANQLSSQLPYSHTFFLKAFPFRTFACNRSVLLLPSGFPSLSVPFVEGQRQIVGSRNLITSADTATTHLCTSRKLWVRSQKLNQELQCRKQPLNRRGGPPLGSWFLHLCLSWISTHFDQCFLPPHTHLFFVYNLLFPWSPCSGGLKS